MRILVVDDEAAVRESLERSLRFEAPRSACAVRSGRPGGTCACSSSPRRCCWRSSATSSPTPTGYATDRGWRIVVPASAVAAGIGAALLVGAAAGLYPAVRAARLPPTEALRSV